MTHLYIELNTGLTEEVNSSIISKLYELAISGDLDETSDLKGRLHMALGYRTPIEYLNNTFLDLYIIADNYAVPFEDPNMLQYLLNKGIGSNNVITEVQAVAVTSPFIDSLNTTVTKFNELKYFTGITGSRGGYTSTLSGNIKFYGWSALEEIDISNLTCISHATPSGWEDGFRDCSSLKTVTASNKLEAIGVSAFLHCNNLETISGLSGTITIAGGCFLDCYKLKQENFNNVVFHLPDTTSDAFRECRALTSLAFDDTTSVFGANTFFGCNSLQSVTGLSNVTTIKQLAFYGCSSLSSIDIDFSKITTIENSCFLNCQSLVISNLSCPNLTSLGGGAFLNTKVLKVSNLGTIEKINGSTFNACGSLTEVTIPSSCQELNDYAFTSCSNLTTVNLPTGLLYIGNNVFHSTKLTGPVVLPNTLLKIKNDVFLNTKITSITYPASLTLIYGGTSEIDSSTNLKRLRLPAVSTLQSVVFESGFDIPELTVNNMEQVSMTIPDTVRFITGVNENNNSTTLYTFSNNSNVEYIGRELNAGLYINFDFTTDHTLAEYQTLLNTGNAAKFNVTFNNFPKNNIKVLPRGFQYLVNKNDIRDLIGNNVVAIGKECFNQGSRTSFGYSITLPASLKFVGEKAFRNVVPTSWIFEGTTPPIFEVSLTTFSDAGAISTYASTIYVPSSAVAAYLAALPDYAGIIQANPNS